MEYKKATKVGLLLRNYKLVMVKNELY